MSDFEQIEFRFDAPEALPSAPRKPREFIGWHRPLVGLTADWLWEQGAGLGTGRPVDLSSMLVLVPTRGAARGLRRALLERAAAEGEPGLLPPEIQTPSFLLNLGLESSTVATPLHRLVAWVEVIQKIDTGQFPNLFPRSFRSPGFGWALQLARDLIGLQDTLGEGGLSLSAAGELIEAAVTEQRRWGDLARLDVLYGERIRRMGFRDSVEARREALRTVAKGFAWQRVALVGIADPPPAVEAVLHVLGAIAEIDVVVGAPESLADDFDMWGRPLPGKWTIAGRPLPLAPDQIHLVADQWAEAQLVAGRFREGGASTVSQVGVGVADPSVSDPLVRELGREGWEAFDPDGTCYFEAPIWGFLEGFAELLRSAGSFSALQKLARHPTCEAFLPEEREDSALAGVLRELDDLECRRIPASVTSALAGIERRLQHADSPEEGPVAITAKFLRGIRGALSAFASRPIDEAVEGLLARIAADPARLTPVDLDLVTALRERSAFVAEALGKGEDLGAAEAFQLVLAGLGMERSYLAAQPGQVQLCGWLDLLWAKEAQVVLTGVNEGHLPGSIVGDAFLPDSQRTQLGLRDNAARLARDRFLLELLLRSRADGGRVDLVLAKTDLSGDPLKPSRLLFACPDEELPQRVGDLYGEPSRVTSAARAEEEIEEANAPAWSRSWPLALPYDPEQLAARTRTVSPTALRDYLACPFVFYLKQVLRMEPITPEIREMDHRAFGNLCHEAFEELGKSDTMRQSIDPEEIAEFLVHIAERRVRGWFGSDLPVAVQVQMESVRQRLRGAAKVQAGEREEGWVIVAAELRLPGTRGGEGRDGTEEGEPFLVGGTPLTGIIDRVERNERTGAVRVIDYKTSGRAKPPREAHLSDKRTNPERVGEWRLTEIVDKGKTRNRRWENLQLPLYAAYLGQRDPFGWGVEPGAIQVGYFNLPLAVTRTSLEIWEDFDGSVVRSALDCATEVVRRMKAGVFWPPEADAMVARDYARLAPRGFEEDFDPSTLPGGVDPVEE